MKPADKDKIYLIYPYYDNPQMLAEQVEHWNFYPDHLKEKMQIIIVDDCSPNSPAAPIMKKCEAPKKVFRVMENIPWAQHHARNIGAKVVKGDNSWLFMSDMDIGLPHTSFEKLFNLDPERYHTFERNYVGGVLPPKFHLNTFLVKRKYFWAVNGYDVDFCGTYGGDSQFLVQLARVAPQLHHGLQSHHLKPTAEISGEIINVWGFERDVIPDANTREWSRKEGVYRDKFIEVLKKKKAAKDFQSRNPIRWPYERVL